MKRFSIYMYLAFCLLTSCSNCKSNLESPIVHVNIPKYTTTDSGAVSYAVGNTGTGDQVNSVTYSLKGGTDTTIKNPARPFFWESTVVPGQGVSFSADATKGSSGSGLNATMFVYDHKGLQVYTNSVNFK